MFIQITKISEFDCNAMNVSLNTWSDRVSWGQIVV
jgi:hypothetical protein